MTGGFVSVRGLHLELDGSAFRFAGANCYYLQTYGSYGSEKHRVAELFDQAQKAGLTVLRCWAHSEGSEPGNIQQGCTFKGTSDGVGTYTAQLNEEALQGLDFVLAQARRTGIRLILSLTNYWEAYGGMRAYIKFAGIEAGVDKFYSSGICQGMFRNYVKILVQRVNTITKVAYRDDPFIMAWSIANEPRYPDDPSGAGLTRWIAQTAAFVKSIDRNHLVTVDVEGFFSNSTPDIDVQSLNPKNLNDGCDFIGNCGQDNIDFACMHMYTHHWLPPDLLTKVHSWIHWWLDAHTTKAASKLRKPIVLNEVGFLRNGNDFGERRDFLHRVLFKWALPNMQQGDGNPVAGVCVWMLADRKYRDEQHFDDGFQICLDDPQSDDGKWQLIQFAEEVGKLKPLPLPLAAAS